MDNVITDDVRTDSASMSDVNTDSATTDPFERTVKYNPQRELNVINPLTIEECVV